jgi:allophanate hydrolase
VSRADPVAVAERAHAAAVEHAETSGAWISLVDRDWLLERAGELAAGPSDLPLHGVPFGIKDNIDLEGLPTTAACPPFAYRPERSAAAVRRLMAAGALPLGKTNLDQFATGLVGTRSPYGPCSSVADPSRVAGGSSSGSGVAVGAGVVPLALGTDTAGSGRVPAAFNGVVGVKPTRGLVSTAGVVPACRSLDCVSVFSAGVELGRRALAVLAGVDFDDAYSRPARAQSGWAGAPVRIGVPGAACLDTLEPAGAEAWSRVVAAAAAIADEVVEVDLDPFLETGRLLYDGPWVAERYAVAGEWLARGGPGIDPAVREIVLGGRAWSAVDVFRAQEQLAGLRQWADATWLGIDTLLLPTAPFHPTHADVAADPIGVNARLGTFTTFANLLDLCAVAVPAGTRSDGLPFGVTLLAPAFHDTALLDLAARWPAQDAGVELVVCGAHLRGMPLNGQLLELGARFVRATATAPVYRLVALPGGPPQRPGLIRTAEGEEGRPIDVEVWRLDAAALGRLTASVPAPLAIGTVALADAAAAPGFLCESYAAAGAEDITAWGGWRAYCEGAMA